MNLAGKTITDVRPMTPAEAEREGWTIDNIDGPPVVLEIGGKARVERDGKPSDPDKVWLLYPSRDPEGNGPGALFGTAAGLTFTISANPT